MHWFFLDCTCLSSICSWEEKLWKVTKAIRFWQQCVKGILGELWLNMVHRVFKTVTSIKVFMCKVFTSSKVSSVLLVLQIILKVLQTIKASVYSLHCQPLIDTENNKSNSFKKFDVYTIQNTPVSKNLIFSVPWNWSSFWTIKCSSQSRKFDKVNHPSSVDGI